MRQIFFILYVRDQVESAAFYTEVLDVEPSLDVPGITEFALSDTTVLALMPETGIKHLLGEALPDPSGSRGASKAEVYLVVDDPESYHARAIGAGATELRSFSPTDWGHDAAYSLDPDFHVLAFARVTDDN